MYDLTENAAIVTGASSGIGRAIAERLAREGVSLCLVAAPEDKDDLKVVADRLESEGARAIAFPADVGEHETAGTLRHGTILVGAGSDVTQSG